MTFPFLGTNFTLSISLLKPNTVMFPSKIVTIGAVLVPKEINENGKTYWVWVVDHFTDETLGDGTYIDVIPLSDTLEGLIIGQEDEDDTEE